MTQAKLQELYEEKLNRDELAKDGVFVRRNLGVKEVEETADGVRVTLGITATTSSSYLTYSLKPPMPGLRGGGGSFRVQTIPAKVWAGSPWYGFHFAPLHQP
jgi:hypothetical protein